MILLPGSRPVGKRLAWSWYRVTGPAAWGAPALVYAPHARAATRRFGVWADELLAEQTDYSWRQGQKASEI